MPPLRRFASTAVLAGTLLGLAAAAGQAHDPRQHIVPDDRIELSLGRTADYDYDPPEPGSYELPTLGPAADGTLLGPDGKPRSLHAVMDGHITVLAFVYTRCADPQGCPLTMEVLHALHYVGGQDPVIGKALRLVTVSFDPVYDTPEVMADYAETFTGDRSGAARWQFLTAVSQNELKPVLRAYNQPIGRKQDADDPYGPLTHQLRVYLIDRAQRIRNIYSLGFLDPRLVIADVRTLLLEEAGASHKM